MKTNDDQLATKKDLRQELASMRLDTRQGMANMRLETQQDLANMKREIVDEISEVLADAMTNIGMNFQQLQEDNRELKHRVQKIEESQNRIEQKLDPTIERVDEHGIEIAKLQQRLA